MSKPCPNIQPVSLDHTGSVTGAHSNSSAHAMFSCWQSYFALLAALIWCPVTQHLFSTQHIPATLCYAAQQLQAGQSQSVNNLCSYKLATHATHARTVGSKVCSKAQTTAEHCCPTSAAETPGLGGVTCCPTSAAETPGLGRVTHVDYSPLKHTMFRPFMPPSCGPRIQLHSHS
jgi:hypothetical protein